MVKKAVKANNAGREDNLLENEQQRIKPKNNIKRSNSTI
jgi:hypothetical protein